MLRIAALFTIVGLAYGASVSDNVTCTWNDCDKPCDSGTRTCDRSDGKTWNIDCHVQDCFSDGKCGDADVVFVLDSSASLGEKNWWKTLQFVIDVSKGLKIGADASRVAVVIYSNKGQKMWDLNAYNDMASLEAAIWDIEFLKGNTNTYEGMLYAQEILRDTGRANFKHIVIVITDGKSNNKADLVKPKADEMHKEGTEVFCVGVTGNVDEDEIKTIASKPTDTHAHFVNDYNALVAITNTIINDTCEAAKTWDCEAWSVWSHCIAVDPTKQCGAGISSRWRWCKLYAFPGDINPETRLHTETRRCDNACATCARCDFDVYGVGYMEHDNCHKFIRCEYVAGTYIEHEQSCGVLFWRQSLLTCDRRHDEGHICTDGPIDATTTSSTTTPPPCSMSPHPINKAKYIWHTQWGDYEMPCAPGTEFNEFECKCTTAGAIIPQCNSDALLEFPFNTHTNDICDRAVGTIMGDVLLQDDAAYFDGKSRVEVGFLKNWFADNWVSELSISLWFKYTGNDDNFRGIFTNGDCVDEASLLVALGSGIAQGQVRTENKTAALQYTAKFDDVGATTRSILKNEWVFVTMVYSGEDVKYYVNAGSQPSEVGSIRGTVVNTQCAANIGFSASASSNAQHYFQGYIDDVRIYEKALEKVKIDQLFNDGRK